MNETIIMFSQVYCCYAIQCWNFFQFGFPRLYRRKWRCSDYFVLCGNGHEKSAWKRKTITIGLKATNKSNEKLVKGLAPYIFSKSWPVGEIWPGWITWRKSNQTSIQCLQWYLEFRGNYVPILEILAFGSEA